MKIGIAPYSYKESLSALEVATAIEQGLREIWPDADYLKLPLADGGEVTVEARVHATAGRLAHVLVTGYLGHPPPALYALSGAA
uniref:glycerate kinase n=1 Tax=Salmonella enterica TaxID=28901 RepID=UPI00398C2F18